VPIGGSSSSVTPSRVSANRHRTATGPTGTVVPARSIATHAPAPAARRIVPNAPHRERSRCPRDFGGPVSGGIRTERLSEQPEHALSTGEQVLRREPPFLDAHARRLGHLQ